MHYGKDPTALTRALELFSPRPSGGEHLATSAAIGLAVVSLEREPQNTSLDHLIWLCTVFVALRACYAALDVCFVNTLPVAWPGSGLTS